MAKRVDRDAAYDLFDGGSQPKDLVKQGFNRSNVYKWFGAWKREQEPAPVTDVAPPPPVGSATDARVNPTKKKEPVTEKTAGLILAVGFGIWARLAHNDICYLTDPQRKQLAVPFAETLKAIPNPVADLINEYAPPVSFATELWTVVDGKLEEMRMERERAYDPVEAARRAAEEAAAREAHNAAPANGVVASNDVPANKRVSTGTAEPESQGPVFFG